MQKKRRKKEKKKAEICLTFYLPRPPLLPPFSTLRTPPPPTPPPMIGSQVRVTVFRPSAEAYLRVTITRGPSFDQWVPFAPGQGRSGFPTAVTTASLASSGRCIRHPFSSLSFAASVRQRVCVVSLFTSKCASVIRVMFCVSLLSSPHT